MRRDGMRFEMIMSYPGSWVGKYVSWRLLLLPIIIQPQ